MLASFSTCRKRTITFFRSFRHLGNFTILEESFVCYDIVGGFCGNSFSCLIQRRFWLNWLRFAKKAFSISFRWNRMRGYYGIVELQPFWHDERFLYRTFLSILAKSAASRWREMSHPKKPETSNDFETIAVARFNNGKDVRMSVAGSKFLSLQC